MINFLEGDDNLHGIQTMGIVNAIKTGNVVIDMTIAMLIPLVIGSFFTFTNNLLTKLSNIEWSNWFKRKIDMYYERFIHHNTITSSSGTKTDLDGGDSQNDVLMKAIQLYLNFHGILNLKNANLELQQMGEEKEDNHYYYYDYEENSNTTLADTLSKYKVIKKPSTGIWLNLGDYAGGNKQETACKVELMLKENKEDIENGNKDNSSGGISRCELIFHFRSTGKESIDFFIDKAYKWYLDQLRTLEDETRYLYEITDDNSSDDDDNDCSSHRTYKRFQLSDEKTFESLFFKEKDNILKLVENFTNRTGKYGIKGYPHKLGILLHGPPGTGKTSLIKALAQRTGRSIVNVPLSRISTNAELASLFFDQKYRINGERVPVTLGFKDIIFVMEDIDAASKVVKRRDGKTTAELRYTERVDVPLTKSLWRMLLESTDSRCGELVTILKDKSERLKDAANDPASICSAARRMSMVPGLSLIGEDAEYEMVSKITFEAVESANTLMNEYRTVDEFIGRHAETLKQMIDAGGEVNIDLENELLGVPLTSMAGPGSFISLDKASLSRDVSYSKQYGNDDNICIEPVGTGNTSFVDARLSDNETKSDNVIPHDKNNKSSIGVMGPSTSLFKTKKDALNLTGILNVLDGVVDTPGRILIMTTNHPEMLDPALIRPGRIDKKLLLGYMTSDDLVGMVEHYFATKLSDDDVNRLTVAVNGGLSTPSLKLTPAQIEQMASEFDDVEGMLAAIEGKSRALAPEKRRRKPKMVFNM